MGMLSAGSVAGPGVGALASWIGQGPAFLLVAVVSIMGMVMAASAPAGRDVAHQSAIRAGLLRVARQPATRAALALSTADLLVFGTVDVLVPLRLGDEGTAVAVIAAALAGGAMLGAVTGPLAGRAVDRYGPSAVGSTAQAVMLLIPVALAFDPPSAVQLATLVIGGPLFATIGASIFPLSSMGADAAGVSHVTATGLLGAVWATGFTVVPVLAGAVAQAASASTAYVVVLLLCVAPLVVVVRSRPALGGALAG